MGVGVWLCGGCWCVQALHGAQGTASVSGGVRSGQLTPLQGQVTAEIKKKKKTKKNVSETDIKYFFQMFSSSSDKRKYHHSLWEFFMGIRHCSLTFQ